MANQITPAEVLEVIYTDENPNLIYGLKVKEFGSGVSSDASSPAVITAKPLNMSYIRVPIVGEVVLIIKAPSSYASSMKEAKDTYYIDVVSLQSSVHHNALPTSTNKKASEGAASGDSNTYAEAQSGNTQTPQDPKIDENFTENPNIKPLQPYIGDIIINGRYGNSIRLSTTPKSGEFKKEPNWSGGPEAAPISIIRNSIQPLQDDKINNFITEDFTKDDSIIVLASGQNIVFEQSSLVVDANTKYEINSWKNENFGTTPQTLVSSGRIILNSTQQEIMAFAKNGIGLSSETSITLDSAKMVSVNADKIELGLNSDQQMVLGNKWQTWMENLIDAIGDLTDISPVGPCVPTKSDPQWGKVESLKSKIPDLLSDIAFTKKNNNSSSDQPVDTKLNEDEKVEAKDNIVAAKIIADDENYSPPERVAAKEAQQLNEHKLASEENVSTDATDGAPAPIITSNSTKGEIAVQIATRDIGIIESPKGSNTGSPRINQMLKNVGFTKGAFWCAAAVSTWWKEAGMKIPPLLATGGPASCMIWMSWGKSNNRFSSTPAIGAAILYHHGKGHAGANHIGLVSSIDANGKVHTIEGNTTKRGTTCNGGGVFRKNPSGPSILGYVLPESN
jgi:hypothetical protein